MTGYALPRVGMGWRFWMMCALLLVATGDVLEGQQTKPGIAQQSVWAQGLERQVMYQVNAYRIRKKLNPLIHSELLSRVARLHSRHMADGVYMPGHSQFESRGQIVDGAGEGLFLRSENVFLMQCRYHPPCDYAAIALKEWIASASHHQNILESQIRFSGVGVWVGKDSTVYITQLFGEPVY